MTRTVTDNGKIQPPTAKKTTGVVRIAAAHNAEEYLMKTRAIVLTAVTAGALGLGVAATVWSQDRPPRSGQGQADAMQGGFPDFIAGLESIEGCLGVETAQTSSGKNVVFAWFEDKAAVRRWYYSDMHMKVVDQFFNGNEMDGSISRSNRVRCSSR